MLVVPPQQGAGQADASLAAVVGQFPSASSNCASLGGSQTNADTQFNTFCNFIVDGKDLSQNFASTFQDCMSQCSSTTGCNAVSFDASMTQGFKNCYMKTAVTQADNIADPGIDTAIMARADEEADPSSQVPVGPAPSSSVAPPAPPAPSPSSAPIVPAPEPASTTSSSSSSSSSAGAVFFTPPGGATTPISTSTETIISVVTSVSMSSNIPITRFLTTSITTEIPVMASPPTDPAQAASSEAAAAAAANPDEGSSRAWIAAPVVGSVAALVVIAVMFIMLGKRRRTTSSTSSSSSSSSASRHGGGGPGRLSRVPGTPAAPPRRSPMAEAANNLFTTWLPGSPSRRKMGNSSSAMAAGQPQKKSTGTTPPVSRGGSFKAGALGSWWPGGGGGGGSGDDQDIEGLAESRRVEKREVSTAGSTDSRTGLRESFNGLGQHKW
ncbi:hypothetical protein VTK73DRAFT_4625 [Phialemonium thermophilum]|uniref:Apple domain-containing protein n=1 Tax=Phialemonium thermophilum TaxID=223376 RepID=A0ABR3V883_9PEZI